MRVFIAIEMSEEIKEEMGLVQKRIKKVMSGVRWTRVDGIHLTLKFLGEVKEDALPSIYTSIAKAIDQILPFTISLGEIGGFPNLVAPRVIWVGIKRGREEVERIAKKVDDELSLLGYPKEKRELKPHITLGRIKRPIKDEGLEKFLLSLTFPSVEMVVRGVKVMESNLLPDGAVYTTLKEFTFLAGPKSQPLP